MTAAPLLALMAASPIALDARPPETTCPTLDALHAAVEDRIPIEADGWLARYTVTPGAGATAATTLKLELFDDRRRLRLQRELSIDGAGDGCGEAAEGLALILERFFQKVSWTASVPLPEIERAPEPPPPEARRWELQVGPAARLEVALAPALAIDVRATFHDAWALSAGLLVEPLAASQAVGQGTAELRGLPLRASARRRKALGRLALEVGPELSLSAERGTTSGLAGDSAGYRVVVGGGAVGGVRWTVSPGWTVLLEGAGQVTLLGASFMVSGQGEVLAPRRLQALAVLGIAHSL